jgi:hypothetical protein
VRGGGTPLPPERKQASAEPKEGANGGTMGSPVKRAKPKASEAEKEGFEPSMEAFTPITP